jgi:WbqC-like protein family
MIVSCHQPNFLPGLNIMGKLACSDIVIWLDSVQYTKGGFTNRNRLPGGAWLTVPVDRATDGGIIRHVKIAQNGRPWQRRVTRSIFETWGPDTWPLCAIIHRSHQRLVALNAALIAQLMPIAAPHTEQAWQSHLEAPSLDPSIRLAQLVAEVGGTTYLSGPSGGAYLDEGPFRARGIQVRSYAHTGPYTCAASLLAQERVRV